MKKKYVKPEMEITEFDIEDVITTSGTPTGEDGSSNNNEGSITGGNSGNN